MEAWETVVGDLTRALAPSADDAATATCLLELLTVLPEEADNYKVGVTPKRRADFVKMLGEQRAGSASPAPTRPRRTRPLAPPPPDAPPHRAGLALRARL